MNDFDFVLKYNKIKEAQYVKDYESAVRQNTSHGIDSNSPTRELEHTFMLATYAYERLREKSSKELPDFIEYSLRNQATELMLRYFKHQSPDLPTYERMMEVFQHTTHVEMPGNSGDIITNFSTVTEDNPTNFTVNWRMYTDSLYSYLTGPLPTSGRHYANRGNGNEYLTKIIQLQNIVNHLPNKSIKYKHINEYMDELYTKLPEVDDKLVELDYYSNCLLTVSNQIKARI